MVKRMILVVSLLMFTFGMVMPAYAQTPSPAPSQGFFGEIEHFFNGFFHHQTAEPGQTQEQENQPASITPEQNEPTETINPNQSEKSDYLSFQKNRLAQLVRQEKITQAQADAILAELTKVQTELQTWAQSQGINESYVLDGPMGGPMRQGMSQQGFSQQGQTQQFQRPMMMHGDSPEQEGGGPNQQQEKGL